LAIDQIAGDLLSHCAEKAVCDQLIEIGQQLRGRLNEEQIFNWNWRCLEAPGPTFFVSLA
jgi:hypothetical protein